MRPSNHVVLILDNVRSMYNVGAIFRLADGLGVTKLYLCGITATPPRAEIHKTALGTETNVAWEYATEIKDQISEIKKRGYIVVALELTNTAIPLYDYKPTFPLALVVGHETDGVSHEVLKLADVHVQIPMRGHAHSLNVATACAIALWHIQSTQ